MSNIAKVAGQAANTLTKPLNVEEVFSTYLYEGNSSTQTITNGIDLSGEGGLVWTKTRNESTYQHWLFDTERGVNKYLFSALTNAEGTLSNGVTSFNSDGFTVGAYSGNETGDDIVSWTFRKAPKFFDVVTYTGDGVADRTINHNLGSVPACVIVKRLDATSDWAATFLIEGTLWSGLSLNTADSYYLTTGSTQFTDNYINLKYVRPYSQRTTSTPMNVNGGTYVAYLFAHNDGDGDFGDGTQDIIKCGSYTGNGSTNGPEIDLGFEPQWLMVKSATRTGTEWKILDSMRGISSGSNDAELAANSADAEVINTDVIDLLPNGFKVKSTGDNFNTSGETYIYIAIRRGPMAVPESATDVFAMDVGDGLSTTGYQAGFPIDFALDRSPSTVTATRVGARLMQGYVLFTNNTNGEAVDNNSYFDSNTEWYVDNRDSTYQSWMWKRAPNFCDVVAYTGNGTAGRTVSHNLGVAPEMMWVKNRTGSNNNWGVYHKDLDPTAPEDYYIILQSNGTPVGPSAAFWNSTQPTSTQITLGSGLVQNGSGINYIAYLFASLDGVSKVGSFAYNGTTAVDVDCGFTSGARFVLIKCVTAASDWIVFDTERGIVSGNDSDLRLNKTNAENTSNDLIDPLSSGFTLNPVFGSNPQTYIFYAIA